MNNTETAFLKRYFLVLLGLVLAGCLLAVPYTAWWLHSSGDVAVERAVAEQSKGTLPCLDPAFPRILWTTNCNSMPR